MEKWLAPFFCNVVLLLTDVPIQLSKWQGLPLYEAWLLNAPANQRAWGNSFFFFFNEIECKRGRASIMQPLWISKDLCITEEKGKLIKWEGGCVSVCALGFWRFEDYKCGERWRQGESSSSLTSWGQTYWRMKWFGTFLIWPRRVLGISKTRATRKACFGGNYWL